VLWMSDRGRGPLGKGRPPRETIRRFVEPIPRGTTRGPLPVLHHRTSRRGPAGGADPGALGVPGHGLEPPLQPRAPWGGGTTRIQDEKASMARPKQAPRSKCLNPLDSPAGTRLEDTVVRSMVVGTPVQSPWGVPRGAHLLAAGKKMNFRTCKILCSKQK